MKNSIRKINGNKTGTGFFCKVLYEKKLTPVLITNYQILDDNFMKIEKQINVDINGKIKNIKINQNSKIYSSKDYEIMIIKIKEEEVNNYLEIDPNISKENSYEEQSIYLLHYPNNGKISISYGYVIKNINEFDFTHLFDTEESSSGGPILSLSSNKIIGIHKGKMIMINIMKELI